MTAKRPTLISGNWKMNENHYESIKLIQELAALLRAQGVPKDRAVSVHPPFTSIRTVQTAVESDHLPLALGAQTCHFEDRGAFTGEVSAEMLSKLGVTFVLAGHSERRTQLGESDEIVRRKVDAILRNAMRPIICVGESAEQRLEGRAKETVATQLRAALEDRPIEQISVCVIAYEPLWAIGTGQTASPGDAAEMCGAIRAVIGEIAGPGADECLIQYGGSANAENAAALLDAQNVDGLLVGGASLDAAKFMAIVQAGHELAH